MIVKIRDDIERNVLMILDNSNIPLDKFQFRKYIINSSQCTLKEGDFITPGTIVGLHYETGQPVKADINGRVVTVHHRPATDSIMMLAVAEVTE